VKAALQQGNADGLCGLYALMNFLHRTCPEDWNEATDTLWYLLDAARQFGWFNPYTITQGFEEYQLKAIIDLLIQNYRMGYETFFVSDAAESLDINRFVNLAERVAEKKGSIIASWDARCHWVLVTSEKGEVVVVDSAAGGESRPLSQRQRALDLKYGLVILPAARSIPSIAL